MSRADGYIKGEPPRHPSTLTLDEIEYIEERILKTLDKGPADRMSVAELRRKWGHSTLTSPACVRFVADSLVDCDVLKRYYYPASANAGRETWRYEVCSEE